ncbi:glycogen/starch synthase [uncultured Alloprevotella sp.]|jgi:putative starch synthase|uniref:glycogen/starch synthase n=1 Tax=uncultured Alloprevotella sp. TaxID=1283315 RepID=UPI00325FC58F
MVDKQLKPDFIFEASWEVCNKVGGIYTVLSSRAQTLLKEYGDKLIFLGPDIWQEKNNPDFLEDKKLLKNWREAAAKEGVNVRIGRWQVAGRPVAVLVDFQPFFEQRNFIYGTAWQNFGVQSDKAYGDYDEASMFSYAAARFVEIIYLSLTHKNEKVVYQAHEWMAGLGMLHLRKAAPSIATIFTTHATSIGRSITSNNKQLYKYFHGYNGDQMAEELHMDAKHSVEKKSAHFADCFTTVSTFTNEECVQLLEKPADVILPNGFDNAIVPKGSIFTTKRKAARKNLLRVASALLGEELSDKIMIVSTSGRNDFRCKGFDVFLQAMANLNSELQHQSIDTCKTCVLALIEVPCWIKQPRKDLQLRLIGKEIPNMALPNPYLTHELYNEGEDAILNTMRSLSLMNDRNNPVKVILLPCYLDGEDGIINEPYYEVLLANDLCIYPSYYEPWGYTPLEASAFKIPCITTDLSGFGQWVDATLKHQGMIEDGVEVLHRNDDNYFDVAQKICNTTMKVLNASKTVRNEMRKNAAALADKAQWSNFIKYYYQAYDFALRKK